MYGKTMVALNGLAFYVSLIVLCICLPVAIATLACDKWHAIYWIGGFFFSGVATVVFYTAWDVGRFVKRLDDECSPAMLERAGKV